MALSASGSPVHVQAGEIVARYNLMKMLDDDVRYNHGLRCRLWRKALKGHILNTSLSENCPSLFQSKMELM